jgi:RND superfamily putative drug exporter
MQSLIRAVLSRPWRAVAAWSLLLALAAVFAFRLPGAVRGSSDAIADSESGRATAQLQKHFGPASAHLFPVVVESSRIPAGDPRFAARVLAIADALSALQEVQSVDHYWNTGASELLGRDGRSALVLVRPRAASFFEAEDLTGRLRAALAGLQSEEATATVTGVPAMFHDLNRNSSADLLRAERIGLPAVLLILLVVFRSPVAAALPLLVALIAVTVASAGLYLLSGWLPVSVFARNAVAMIGLGVGVDYALFLLGRFRAQLERGDAVRDAAQNASAAAGHAVLVSGIAVGAGCAGLLLVKADFVHSIAIGAALVVASAVAATLTLLPVLLLWLGPRVNWPANGSAPRLPIRSAAWGRWIRLVMARPWTALAAGLAVAAALAAPALRMTVASAGVSDLAPQFESRRGFDALERNFEPGWMGPVLLLVESRGVLDGRAQDAINAIAARLEKDPRVAQVHSDPRHALSPDGTAALLVLVAKHGPDSAAAFAFLKDLRADPWAETSAAGLAVKVSGATAMIADFDAELLGSLWRVIPAVLAVTFVVLMAAFRSLVIPLKAIALNFLSVLMAYGFLVLVFQDGMGASLLGIAPPGGLNSLVVLMLFTLLFGISMDYEVFLLRQVQEEYRRCGDNRRAVRAGLERSASLITSAAAIMVVLFGAFGFTQFTATREFGLGLAFAVALDATLIRLILVPALLELFGAANWWLPGRKHAGRTT